MSASVLGAPFLSLFCAAVNYGVLSISRGHDVVNIWLPKDSNPRHKNDASSKNAQSDITQKPNTLPTNLRRPMVKWLLWWCLFVHIGLYPHLVPPIAPLGQI